MTKDIRICFVGDSFVNGTGDETALGWVGRLSASAHARNFPITYYNLGIRRNTSKDILGRWETECSLRLPEACDGRVVFSCGVNDTAIENGSVRVPPEESCANIRDILRDVKKYKVLMIGPPPVGDESQNERIMALSQLYAAEAKFLGVQYIDLFFPLASDVAYKREVSGNDGSHPRSSGYAKMANIISSSSSWWFYAP
ncbi:GDSL-type esterase/lipase family protein [Guyparkeria sp. 1SP6A2]|nr:GDSL-type esterase/lipase family protein [Guyparkeria sp. 1SP6A2]